MSTRRSRPDEQEFELVPHTRTRQAIGERTVQSVNETPQFRVHKLVEAGALLEARAALKQRLSIWGQMRRTAFWPNRWAGPFRWAACATGCSVLLILRHRQRSKRTPREGSGSCSNQAGSCAMKTMRRAPPHGCRTSW